MPNAFALFMLAIWPLVSLALFRRYTPAKALIWSIMVAYLVLPPLPAAFDLPLLPPLEKSSIPQLTALLICAYLPAEAAVGRITRRFRLRDLPFQFLNPANYIGLLRRLRNTIPLPDSRAARLAAFVFVFSPALTVLNNPEPLVFQQMAIRGLYLRDAIALPLTQALILVGFLLARRFLFEAAAQVELLRAFMLTGLVYSLPVLLEIRLSPQLNIWVYGYFQHVFEQMVRAGGFRAIVFLNHGIWVAFFIMTATVATVAFWRHSEKTGNLALMFATAWLAATLALSKTLASFLYAVFLVPLVWFLGVRAQIRIAALLAALAIAYPMAKGVDLVPVDWMLQQAGKVSAERAGSLAFRFDNEDLLMQRANEKPLFGWGSWGRNHIRDPGSGTIESVTDGRWIITFGVYGWVGFLAEFSLLAMPLFLLWRETRRLGPAAISPFAGVLALLLGVNIIDLLPNATVTPMTWLMAGALLGYAESLRKTSRHLAAPDPPAPRKRTHI
ncbi:MAG: hypothetical protein K8F59_11705 [Rhodobacteraceae bacterium]|nr:hypothetical protein [Paracoccaceae bacterium]